MVVFGDVSRSPRTRNHAVGLARRGIRVTLIGFFGSKNEDLPFELRVTNFIDKKDLPQFSCPFAHAPYALYVVLRVLHDLFFFGKALTETFCTSPESISWILMQNPPMVPQIFLCKLLKIFTEGVTKRSCQVVVDFHNYGYTILETKLGSKENFLVSLLRFFEMLSARLLIDQAFCVTEAMKKNLVLEWGLEEKRIAVLYDKRVAEGAVEGEKKSSSEEKAEFWVSLQKRGHLKELDAWNNSSTPFFQNLIFDEGRGEDSPEEKILEDIILQNLDSECIFNETLLTY